VHLAYDADGFPRQRLVLPVPPVLAVPAVALTVDADNRVTTANGATVTHDADGQLATGSLPSGTPATYTFDVRHRLQSIGGVSYTYDVEDHRLAMATSAGTVWYTVDPHGGALPRVLVREEPNGSATLAVYGLGLLYEVDASGAARYSHYDETGSTIALTMDDGLVVTDRMGYGPFGTLVVRKGTTPTPYLYGGAFGVETDPNGLLYMRARYYHPLLRRFISPDPIGFAGGLNWYVYAGNNPYQFGDPTGLGQQHLVPGSGSLWTHVEGGAMLVIGTVGLGASLAGAVITSPTVGGAVAFAGGGTLSADMLVAGRNQLVSGEPQSTMVGRWLHTVGTALGLRAEEVAGVNMAMAMMGGPPRGPRGRGRNQFRGPDPAAQGAPHTRFRVDAQGVTHYETYGYNYHTGQADPRVGRRVDVIGPPHGGVPTPHYVDTTLHINPFDLSQRYMESRPHPATPEMIPYRRP
jgi:RHS repeat-associated protein